MKTNFLGERTPLNFKISFVPLSPETPNVKQSIQSYFLAMREEALPVND